MKRLTTVMAAGFAMWLGLSEPAGAQNPGLDLVVMIDQSGSMVGEGTGVKSDPHNIRNHMVTFTLELLANSARHNGLEHRLGVVSFGSTVRVDLPITRVSPDDFGRLRADVEQIATRSPLGNTDFLAAFREAARQFTRLPAETGRQRALLLITDGAPYVTDIEVPAYSAELRSSAAGHFPYPDYRIEVVALNDPASDYWQRYRNLWQKISNGHARKLDGDEHEMLDVLHELLTDLAGVKVVDAEKEFEPGGEERQRLLVPPYLESVVFDIFSLEPDLTVAIFPPSSPDGPLTADSPGVEFGEIGGILRSVTVRRPEAGPWLFRASQPEARVAIYSQQFFPRGDLALPAPDATLRQFDRTIVEYRLADGEGNPVQELPGYPLELDLALGRPDGTTTRMAMEEAPGLGEGVFRSRDEFECDQSGRYQTKLQVATRDLNARPVTIYEDRWSGFTVAPARRIECTVARPTIGERIPLYGKLVFSPRPVELRLECRDGQGGPVNMAALLKGPVANFFEAKLERQGLPVPAVAETSDRQAGLFDGRLVGPTRWGLYQLKLTADRERVPEPYTVVVSPPELSFERHLTWWHWLQLGVLVASALTVALVVVHRLWLLWRAPLCGTLFIDRLETGQQIAALALGEGRRHNRKKLTGLPLETQLAWLDVRALVGRQPSLTVTAATVDGEALFAQPRTLRDREQIVIPKIPYRLKYHL